MGCYQSRLRSTASDTTTEVSYAPSSPGNCPEEMAHLPSPAETIEEFPLAKIQVHLSSAMPAHYKRNKFSVEAKALRASRCVCKAWNYRYSPVVTQDHRMEARWRYIANSKANKNLGLQQHPVPVRGHGGGYVPNVVVHQPLYQIVRARIREVMEGGGRLLTLFPVHYNRAKVAALAEEDLIGRKNDRGQQSRILSLTRMHLPTSFRWFHNKLVKGEVITIRNGGHSIRRLAPHKLTYNWDDHPDYPGMKQRWTVGQPYGLGDEDTHWIKWRPHACAGLQWGAIYDRFKAKQQIEAENDVTKQLAEMWNKVDHDSHDAKISIIKRETYWDDVLDDEDSIAINKRIGDKLQDRERIKKRSRNGCFDFVSQALEGASGVARRRQLTYTHHMQQLGDTGKRARVYHPDTFQTESPCPLSADDLSTYDRLKVGTGETRGCVGFLFEDTKLRIDHHIAQQTQQLMQYTKGCIDHFKNQQGEGRLEFVDAATKGVLGDKVTGWYRDAGWLEEHIALVHSATVNAISIPSLAELRTRAAQSADFKDAYQIAHGAKRKASN